MLSAHALTTVEMLKAELSIPADDTSRDAELARAINAASDAARRYCGRDFARTKTTEHLAGRGAPSLLVSLSPIVSVEAVAIDGQEIDLADLVIDYAAGIIVRLHGIWPECDRPNVSVTYTGGWVTPAQAEAQAEGEGLVRDLPHDIEEACLIIAATRVQSMGQPVDAQILQVEQIRVHWSEGGRQSIPQQAATLLEPYVRWT